jgi:hypothetical protein
MTHLPAKTWAISPYLPTGSSGHSHLRMHTPSWACGPACWPRAPQSSASVPPSARGGAAARARRQPWAWPSHRPCHRAPCRGRLDHAAHPGPPPDLPLSAPHGPCHRRRRGTLSRQGMLTSPCMMDRYAITRSPLENHSKQCNRFTAKHLAVRPHMLLENALRTLKTQ